MRVTREYIGYLGDLKLKKLNIRSASSSYPTLGTEYGSPGYTIRYLIDLLETRKHYRYEPGDENEIGEGFRISTAAEELAIQRFLEGQFREPRKSAAFRDTLRTCQWTATSLRVPKSYDSEKYETDAKGRKYFPRIVLEFGEEKGEILVPEGDGRVIVEWDPVFGTPRVTSNNYNDMRYGNHTTHFKFNPDPPKDPRTKEYDLPIVLGNTGFIHGHEGCLDLIASNINWIKHSPGGVRPVMCSLI